MIDLGVVGASGFILWVIGMTALAVSYEKITRIGYDGSTAVASTVSMRAVIGMLTGILLMALEVVI